MRAAALALAVALIANAGANVLIRMGMRDLVVSPGQPLQLLRAVLLNGQVMAGIALFAFNIIAYAFALSRIRLSIAYPVMTSLGLIIVLLLSWQLMGERITPVQVGGMVLIIGGVVLVASQMG